MALMMLVKQVRCLGLLKAAGCLRLASSHLAYAVGAIGLAAIRAVLQAQNNCIAYGEVPRFSPATWNNLAHQPCVARVIDVFVTWAFPHVGASWVSEFACKQRIPRFVV
jgi:hypothetical protein